MVRLAPFFIFMVFKKITFLSKDNDLFGFVAYILMNFNNFLQIITDCHKL